MKKDSELAKQAVLRLATIDDADAIRKVHYDAFAESEQQLVAKLATDLLDVETNKGSLTIVAEHKNQIFAHVALSPVSIEGREGWQGYILAPLGVLPEYQKSGLGSELIEKGLSILKETKAEIVFVYGDPKYYGRFGFNTEDAEKFSAPFDLEYPFGWQAMPLTQTETEKQPVKITCVPALMNPELW